MILKDQHHPETNTYLRICSLPDNPVSADNEITKESSAPVSRVLFRHDLSAITSVPVIYLLRKSPCGSSVLPSIGISRAGNPQTMVYANLQPPDGTARRSPAGWWSLTPPSHPYHIIIYGGCFLLPSPTVTNSFYFRKWSTLRCPDFPPVSQRHRRQAVALRSFS